jgi:predicted MPP superfamily phosphohydrolase
MGPITEKRIEMERLTGRHKICRHWWGRFQWEDMDWLERLIEKTLRAVGLYKIGFGNLFDFRIEKVEIGFANLPEAFDGLRLLWLSDFHIEPLDGLAEALVEAVQPLQYDIAILGGDWAFCYDLNDTAVERMKIIAEPLLARGPVYGILGNHDRYEMGRILQQWGVQMMVNEHTLLGRDGQTICLAAVDDCHYYEGDDLAVAAKGIDSGLFKILLSHSPEIIHKTRPFAFDLCLCGHTHGGQVCLPGGFPPVICASVGRRFARGLWHHHGMTGYTSRGIGVSGIPVRFFCPPEITLLTLRRK